MLSRVLFRRSLAPTAFQSSDPGPALPLSWARMPIAEPQFQRVVLPLSRITWLAHADLPVGVTFAQVYQRRLRDWPSGLLLRGCSPELAVWLAARGWATARVGIEGRIDLAGTAFQRRSVQKMVHAARRHGVVCEVPWSVDAAARLDTLAMYTRAAARPQLRNLFRQRFTPGTRCFAFIGAGGQWYGALLLSLPSPDLAVTELMLRLPHTPGGVIESLFAHVGGQLHTEAVRWLSLNEVPFHHQSADLTPTERLISLAGRRLHSVYNASGLLRFKAKFQPIWRPVYLCARPRLSLTALADLFLESGCAELWFSGWRRT